MRRDGLTLTRKEGQKSSVVTISSKDGALSRSLDHAERGVKRSEELLKDVKKEVPKVCRGTLLLFISIIRHVEPLSKEGYSVRIEENRNQVVGVVSATRLPIVSKK